MSDFDDDEVVVVGRRLPRLASIVPVDFFNVAVTWEAGTREGKREIVNLAPALARFKVYAPLLDDLDLFRTVRLQEHRYGVTWGDGPIDMGAATIVDAADEMMTAEDFAGFMARHGFTLDRVAAELGISRRMAAYYKKQTWVPRTVALACRYFDLRAEVQAHGGEAGQGPIDVTANHIRDMAASARREGKTFTREDVLAAEIAKRAVDDAFDKIRRGNAGKVALMSDCMLLSLPPANDERAISLEEIKSIVIKIMDDQSEGNTDARKIAGFMLRQIEMTQIHLSSENDIESTDHAQLG